MKLLILSFAFLFVFNVLNAQTDSLVHYTLTQLDSIYKTKKKPQEQLPYALALLQKGEKELDTKDTVYAKLLFKVGFIYRNLREWSNAINYLKQAITIWELKNPIHEAYANCLDNLGAVYYYQKKNTETETYWLKALDIRKKVFGEEHVSYANSLNTLGVLYMDMNDYAKAESYYLHAMNIRKKILGEEHPRYAGSLNNLGLLYSNMGHYQKAENYYLQCINTERKILGENHIGHAKSFNNIGILYMNMGEYIKAEGYMLQALSIMKKNSEEKNPDYAGYLLNLGGVYKDMGAYNKAEETYFQVVNLWKKILGEEAPDYASSLLHLGNLYNDIGDYDKAKTYYLQASDIWKKAYGEEHPDYAQALYSLGSLCKNDNAKAETYYLQATNIWEKTLGNEAPRYAIGINTLGKLYTQMGDYTKAEGYYIQVLNLWKKILGEDHPSYIISLIGLGQLYYKMGDYVKAEDCSLQALNINKKKYGEKHPDYANILNSLGELYQGFGNYKESDIYFSKCLSTKNQGILTHFSWLSEKGKTAYWYKEKAFYEGFNNYAVEAAESFPEAAVLAYNSSLVSKGLLLEFAKEIESVVSTSKDSVLRQIYHELKDKRRLINHLTSSGTGRKEILEEYEVEADSLDKILVNRLGDYAISKRKFQITWKDVRDTLAENEMAIEFARYLNKQDSQYYYMALLLRKSYELPKLVKLGSEKAISAIPAGKGFGELYKLIWEPMDSFLQDVNTVYYSPDGVLNNIAFAALCSKGTEKVVTTKGIKRGSVGKTGTETENCTYLSERYTLHQLSITRYLAEGLKPSKVENSMLVFGGVNYDEIPTTGDTIAEVQLVDFEDYALTENIARSSTNQSRMDYLPGTQTELQNVQKIMRKKQWKIRAFSDKNASENTLKTEIQKESPSVLHIATHGFAFPDIVEKKNDNKTYRDADNPMARCGLLLAGANHSWTGDSKTVLAQTGEDGILTALEVSNLPLKNTKLVVLSACETGLGKIQGTEGVFGLKRGFKLALVEQIIVSLWSVPDKETMELMDIFYNDLAKTHNAVISFEKAQKEMRKKYATRPDLWAGFVLVR